MRRAGRPFYLLLTTKRYTPISISNPQEEFVIQGGEGIKEELEWSKRQNKKIVKQNSEIKEENTQLQKQVTTL